MSSLDKKPLLEEETVRQFAKLAGFEQMAVDRIY